MLRRRPRRVPVPVTSAPTGGCFAPSMQLKLFPTGDVRACCWATSSLGSITRQRLPEIWAGARRQALVRRLAADDFGDGCVGCQREIAVEGRAGSHPAYFDDWHDALVDHPGLPQWPARMEFEISITCNLQCIQCSGANSSSIRLHRERRPPLVSPYDDRFFTDLRLFLPHLVDASFVGGEPFLGPDNFRIWDAMAADAPHVATTICTNGTQWSDRVVGVLDALPVDVIVSIDGATPATFAAMRPGASLERVVTNLDRFCEHASATGRRVQINFCLMAPNLHELPRMLELAEERDVDLNVIVVRAPADLSVAGMAPDRLAAALDELERSGESVVPHLRRNAHVWSAEIERMRGWLGAGATRGDMAGTILMFPRLSDAPWTGGDARADLAAVAVDGVVHHLVVDREERIGAVPVAFASRLGIAPDLLAGRHLRSLLEVIERWEPVVEGPDRLDADIRFTAGPARASFVAVRDERGWADEVDVLVAFVDAAP